MSKKYITTINGEELPISKTKKFPKGYYKIGDINVENSGDCYKINDKFYRFETGQVIFNYSIKQYQLETNDLILGLVENNKFGYFNKNEKNKIPIVLENGNKSFAINEKVLNENLNYREELSTGNFVHISKLPASNFNKIFKPSNELKTSLPYDSRGITDSYNKIYNSLYDEKINNNSNILGEFLKELTFGLEFETTDGFVPERITKKLGLIPLRDGSITGLEYVTVPLSGKKGVQTVVDICKELEKRTRFNNSCALHLHIGNVPRTPEFILAFLKVSSWLQNDIFSMFPIYKKYNMGIKNKNYSKPYNLFDIFSQLDPVINSSNINKNFDVLFTFLTSNKSKFKNYNYDLQQVQSHPLDPSSNQKWNIRTRYYFHNFIPLIFGNKQTIEFRIHTPTFDYYKILMFLLFNSLLIKFTIKYQNKILSDVNFLKSIENYSDSNITLINFLSFQRKDVTNDVSKLIGSLINYFSNRKYQIERLTSKGEIVIEEKNISSDSYIDFDKNRNLELEKSNVKLDNEEIFKEHYLEPLQNTINVVSKKPVFKRETPGIESYALEYLSMYDIVDFTNIDINDGSKFKK